MFGLHSRLITQLADQPGFGWNSCNIFFFFLHHALRVSMAGDHVAADKGHRSIDELLDATVTAKTYGVNARELLLQAARQIAQVCSLFK